MNQTLPTLKQTRQCLAASICTYFTKLYAGDNFCADLVFTPTSLKQIDTQINFGWLILTVHHLAGNGFTILALIQIVVMFFSEQFRPAWIVAWVSGILLTLSAVGLGWTSMILDWSQQGFWRFKIELGTIEAIPLIGSTLSTILTGGEAISTETVVHLYTLHSYVLSIVAIGLAIFHLAGLSVQEQGIDTAIAPDLDPPV